MSLLFALDQLNPAMRKQAEEKMRQLRGRRGTEERTVILPGPDAPKVVAWKGAPRKKGSAPLIPKLKDPKEKLCFHLRAVGLRHFETEFHFHPSRKWRIDIAFVAERLAIEIEGVTPEGSRHQRIAGFRSDIKKYNELTLAGWSLLRFMPEMVSSGHAVTQITRTLEARAPIGGVRGASNDAEEKQRSGRDPARRGCPEVVPKAAGA